jgi:beta-glucanase (GH16 family)
MTNIFFCLLYLFIAVSCSVTKDNEKLIWSDEFDYEGLPDATKWSYEVGMLRNNESQFYTKARQKNARVTNGNLIIEAHKENFDSARFTSASLHTQDTKLFTYGRIEVKAKLPMGRGTWPAAWMLGESITTIDWPACGEIDIMENVGFDSLVIHGNVHTEAYNHVRKTNKGNRIIVSDPWEVFHVYAVEWREQKIDFFVDDQLYFTFEKEKNSNDVWPFNKPHFLILNLAIGGGWGGQQGIDESKFPHRYVIDYVRVYRL